MSFFRKKDETQDDDRDLELEQSLKEKKEKEKKAASFQQSASNKKITENKVSPKELCNELIKDINALIVSLDGIPKNPSLGELNKIVPKKIDEIKTSKPFVQFKSHYRQVEQAAKMLHQDDKDILEKALKDLHEKTQHRRWIAEYLDQKNEVKANGFYNLLDAQVTEVITLARVANIIPTPPNLAQNID